VFFAEAGMRELPASAKPVARGNAGGAADPIAGPIVAIRKSGITALIPTNEKRLLSATGSHAGPHRRRFASIRCRDICDQSL
jgi:hypothetical protein